MTLFLLPFTSKTDLASTPMSLDEGYFRLLGLLILLVAKNELLLFSLMLLLQLRNEGLLLLLLLNYLVQIDGILLISRD